jgi:hypothetical protein
MAWGNLGYIFGYDYISYGLNFTEILGLCFNNYGWRIYFSICLLSCSFYKAFCFVIEESEMIVLRTVWR